MDNNLEQKNEYFAKREEKEKLAREEKSKRMAKRGMRWLTLIVITGLFVWWVYDYFKTASLNNVNAPGEYFQAQSRDHIDAGSEHPAYNSNPPTGGWHYDQPAQTGIYDVEMPDERLVHNLEHSHIWIAYRPDLPADQIEKLANIAKDYGSKIIMTPRLANDTPVALVAWEHLFKMETIDEILVRSFIDTHRGVAGPEKLVDFGFDDFRNSNAPPELGGQMK